MREAETSEVFETSEVLNPGQPQVGTISEV